MPLDGGYAYPSGNTEDASGFSGAISDQQLARPYIEGWLLVLLRQPTELEAIDHGLRFELPRRARLIFGGAQ